MSFKHDELCFHVLMTSESGETAIMSCKNCHNFIIERPARYIDPQQNGKLRPSWALGTVAANRSTWICITTKECKQIQFWMRPNSTIYDNVMRWWRLSLVWRSHTLHLEEEGSRMVSTRAPVSTERLCRIFAAQSDCTKANLIHSCYVTWRKWPPVVEIVRNMLFLSGIQVLRTSRLE